MLGLVLTSDFTYDTSKTHPALTTMDSLHENTSVHVLDTFDEVTNNKSTKEVFSSTLSSFTYQLHGDSLL